MHFETYPRSRRRSRAMSAAAFAFLVSAYGPRSAQAAFSLHTSIRSITNTAFTTSSFISPKSIVALQELNVQTQQRRSTHLALSTVSDPNASGRFSLDPRSPEARQLTSSMGISEDQHDALSKLASLVVDWNGRINLVSRKECTDEIVFGRHVLPSVALSAMPNCPIGDVAESEAESETNNMSMQRKKVVDVGTGGGFPGLPLAIVYPNVDFLLVDSVGKKLTAVQDMAEQLSLDNVKVHHGRVEELVDDPIEGKNHAKAYGVCLGRSVTALPRFCFWISGLMKKDEGKLMYIIGGDVEELVTSQVEEDIPIDKLLGEVGASDKRVLVLPSAAVQDIASKSGEVKRKPNGNSNSRKKKSVKPKKTRSAKGHWAKRDNAQKKERGYDSFQRFES